MRFDTSQKGLNTLFKPYQAAILEYIWNLNSENKNGITSGQIYKFLQQTGDKELMKSMARIIYFLNKMADGGVLGYEHRSWRGRRHRVYFPEMDRGQFASHVVETITNKLEEVFPSARYEAD